MFLRQDQDWSSPTLSHGSSHVLVAVEAILGGLGAQVNHLVKAELTTIDRCCLWFQGDDQLLGVLTGCQGSLEREASKELGSREHTPGKG